MKPQFFVIYSGDFGKPECESGPFKSESAALDWLKRNQERIAQSADHSLLESGSEWSKPYHIVKVTRTVTPTLEMTVKIKLEETK